jgi:hypothetical protein
MGKVEAVELIMAIATAAMAIATFWLVCESRRASFRQIGVQTWLELEQRFDSDGMKRARKKLAQQLKAYSPNKHDKISETVLNFFESVGIAYKSKYLDRKLADSSFSFHACRWWEAVKPYVDQEQKRHDEDDSLFEDFKDLAELMRRPDEKIDDVEQRRFLDDEERLTAD